MGEQAGGRGAGAHRRLTGLPRVQGAKLQDDQEAPDQVVSLELKKFCKQCQKHTVHDETK